MDAPEPITEAVPAPAVNAPPEGAALRRPLKLSVVIPIYNEEATVQQIVRRVVEAPLPAGMAREIVCVNDHSTDGTAPKLNELPALFPKTPFAITHKPVNQGKGAALRDGFARASGDVVLVQDADLEYDPADYMRLLQPIVDGKADVVFGSRFVSGDPHRVLYFWHTLGNKVITFLSNMFTNLNLTDVEVCYKVFRSDVLRRIAPLKCDRFGFEVEVTAKVAKLRPPVRIFEVGIAYYGRSYEEGKKITWRDGVKAILAIVRFRFWD